MPDTWNNTVLVNSGTSKISIKIPEPDRDDLISQMELPSCFGTKSMKLAILGRFIPIRDSVLARFGVVTDEIRDELVKLIPTYEKTYVNSRHPQLLPALLIYMIFLS